jgi:hypothetical protein
MNIRRIRSKLSATTETQHSKEPYIIPVAHLAIGTYAESGEIWESKQKN